MPSILRRETRFHWKVLEQSILIKKLILKRARALLTKSALSPASIALMFYDPENSGGHTAVFCKSTLVSGPTSFPCSQRTGPVVSLRDSCGSPGSPGLNRCPRPFLTSSFHSWRDTPILCHLRGSQDPPTRAGHLIESSAALWGGAKDPAGAWSPHARLGRQAPPQRPRAPSSRGTLLPLPSLGNWPSMAPCPSPHTPRSGLHSDLCLPPAVGGTKPRTWPWETGS